MLFASGERGSAMKIFFKVAIIISSGIAWNGNGNLKKKFYHTIKQRATFIVVC